MKCNNIYHNRDKDKIKEVYKNFLTALYILLPNYSYTSLHLHVIITCFTCYAQGVQELHGGTVYMAELYGVQELHDLGVYCRQGTSCRCSAGSVLCVHGAGSVTSTVVGSFSLIRSSHKRLNEVITGLHYSYLYGNPKMQSKAC